ncbi:MAG: DNA primase [Firmicutes bacterium]|nr:DNA primase [Bacillota bacterium]
MIPLHFIEELKQRNDIVDVIGRYITLTSKGRSWWGNCPFHHENTPSFSINTEGQFYHCFGCKASGNVIKFVQEIESLTFPEAVEKLASQSGMKMPEKTRASKDTTFLEKSKRDTQLNALKDAALYYHNNLNLDSKADNKADNNTANKADNKNSPAIKEALEYFTKRGIDKSLIKRFGLGVSLNSFGLVEYLREKGYDDQTLIDAGLVNKFEEEVQDNYGDVYTKVRLADALGGRLIFPILNNLEQVVAFGGRLTPSTEKRLAEQNKSAGKYINTKNTKIFDKSKNLYAINLVKAKKKKTAVDYIILAEGYMDVIALHTHGFDTAVANMGTALTTEQARLIRRFCNNLYICFDGDKSGELATLKGLDILRTEGLDVKVIKLPQGLDPDDYLKTHGKDKFSLLIDDAKDLTAYKLNALFTQFDMKDTKARGDYAKAALQEIAMLETEVEQEPYIKGIAKVTNINFDTLKAQIKTIPKQVAKPASARHASEHLHGGGSPHGDKGLPKHIIAVLYALITNKPFATLTPHMAEYLDNIVYKTIINYIIESRASGLIPSPPFELLDDEHHSLLSTILGCTDFNKLTPDEAEQFYTDCINKLQKTAREKELKNLQTAYAAEADLTKRAEIAKKIQHLKNPKFKIT